MDWKPLMMMLGMIIIFLGVEIVRLVFWGSLEKDSRKFLENFEKWYY